MLTEKKGEACEIRIRGKNNIVLIIPAKVIYTFKQISVKISVSFSTEADRLVPKFLMKKIRVRKIQDNFEGKNKIMVDTYFTWYHGSYRTIN